VHEEIDDCLFDSVLLDRLWRWIPVTMDGPKRYGLECSASGDRYAWNRTQLPSFDTTPHVVNQELVLCPAPLTEPHRCEVRMVRRATVGELDGETISVCTTIEVDEHFAKLRGDIGRWSGGYDLNQTQVSGLLGDSIL
jgi:hypothetical protein